MRHLFFSIGLLIALFLTFTKCSSIPQELTTIENKNEDETMQVNMVEETNKCIESKVDDNIVGSGSLSNYLSNGFVSKEDYSFMVDNCFVLLFIYLHSSRISFDEEYRAKLSSTFKSLFGSTTVMPETQKEFRLSLIRLVNKSIALPSTLEALKNHYETVRPDFTFSLGNWLDTLDVLSKNPSQEDLLQLLNFSHSSNHYAHQQLDEDFVAIIDELLSKDVVPNDNDTLFPL